MSPSHPPVTGSPGVWPWHLTRLVVSAERNLISRGDLSSLVSPNGFLRVFSQFGLLYSVRVFPNAAVARPGFYAIIKFYSARDAHRAQTARHEKHLFQNSPVKLQDLSDLEERENKDAMVPLQKQSLKFFCALEVVLPSYECRSPGVGMAEEPLEKLEEESGKIAVEYRPCEEITDARTEEELQDLIQVSYFSWKQDGQGEEECLSDLSFEEAEFNPSELD
ncbi:RAD52 motif-containing protein 1-like isoform X3 [Zalophus californianus]|uniref:RAD52 motif-containing protein 1-like isoform X3 n=1 Tax=Zalophus californianus TaxID=9704 RepID=A0A6P9FEZ0_ZALCA|nr:RAD52 motif-containing protein 1-like isoform X3 [Zalophus californianus]